MILQSIWEEAIVVTHNTEAKARIDEVHVAPQRKTFNYLYGAFLGEAILRHSDDFSSIGERDLHIKYCFFNKYTTKHEPKHTHTHTQHTQIADNYT